MKTPHENNLHARLEDLADAAGPWPDPLPGVLERAKDTDRPVAPVESIDARRRMRWVVLSAAAATIVVLGAMVWIFDPFGGTPAATTASAPDQESSTMQDNNSQKEDAAPGAGAVVPPPAVPTCGVLPTQSGPVADIATLTLSAPASGKSGQPLQVDARLKATADGPSLSTGLPLPDVVVVQDGRIVGQFDGPVPMIALSIPITSGMDQPIPQPDQGPALSPPEVLLSGCPSPEPTDPNAGQTGPAERQPLPPGEYQLVAMIDYSVDTADASNPESATGTLVSAPVTITVEN